MQMKIHKAWSSHRTKSRIDIWMVSLDTSLASLPPDYLDMVGKREREKFARFRREADRRRYLVSHVLLRLALSAASAEPVDPRRWQFNVAEKGGPSVAAAAGLPLLHFSLSHSKRLAAVAVSSSFSVGVDVEFLDANSDTVPADLVLAAGEHQWLRSRPAATRWLDFVRLWTVKEAYAKLLGEGVYLDFASFEVAMDPLRLVRSETGKKHSSDLHLLTREVRVPDGSYQLSLAARSLSRGDPQVALHVLDRSLNRPRMGSSGTLRRPFLTVKRNSMEAVPYFDYRSI